MPSLSKAARGKRRWVGIEFDKMKVDVDDLLEQLALVSLRPRIAWTSDDGRFTILESKLEGYKPLINAIGNIRHVKSVTSSGKIRLVKSRISQLYESS
jgi:hypothetical protein